MQSYVFPFDVITMTVTRTEKAITHKDILSMIVIIDCIIFCLLIDF